MARSAFSKVMWVGRATVFMVGLAVILALVLGAATTAMGATGANLILGKFNAAETPTSLVSTLTDAIKPALSVHNKSGGPAVNLSVAAEQAPMKVNPAAGTATGLSADELDGKDSGAFLGKTEKAADSEALGGRAPADYQPRVKWARVFADGSFSGSRGVVSVVRENPGIYKVEFDEDVAHTCSIIGSLNSGSAPGFVKAGSGGTGTPNDTVLVTTQNRDFNYVDNHFYVTVLC